MNDTIGSMFSAIRFFLLGVSDENESKIKLALMPFATELDTLRAELAAAQSELERVSEDLSNSRLLTAWVRSNHPNIADAAILAALQEPTK